MKEKLYDKTQTVIRC